MSQLTTQLPTLRARFPALARHDAGRPAVFFDGPAGTQVPDSVMHAITDYLQRCNANHGGFFATSRESDALLDQVHQGVADFLGADDPDCVCFGPNMTTLTFCLSRALARRWDPGDEIIVTRLDHDANVSPWVLAARDAGALVHFVDIRREDCTLQLDQLHSLIGPRTRLVAVGCASNATGTVNPVRQIADWAHQAHALVFLDAVHWAPHRLVDVEALGGDFLACSAYKFYGPHIGILWGRRALLEQLEAYKVRPAPDELPGKWMTGTQNHACLAGTLAAVDYLADLGRMLADDHSLPRRGALRRAYAAIGEHEEQLIQHLLAGLTEIPGLQVWGITGADRRTERLPTVAVTHERVSTTRMAERLGQRGIFVWHGNYYALQLTEALGLEPEGMVRIGLMHYNTHEEVERLLEELRDLP